MSKIYKIYSACRSKTLIMKIQKKLSIYKIKNQNIQQEIMQQKVYNLMSKKYKYIIENHKREEEQVRSDYVWICWFQGEENAPELVKTCISSVRKYMHGKKICILDEKNMDSYIELPEYIKKKYKEGIIPPAQFSDILRISLLNKYGGIWIDSTVLLTDVPCDSMTESPLFVFKSIDLIRKDVNPIVCSNWYMSAYKNNAIISLTKELLYEYWREEKELIDYFIFHIFFTMATEKYSDDWNAVPCFNNAAPHTLQFELMDRFDPNRWLEIKKISPIHKLNRRLESEDNESVYKHIINNLLVCK